MKFFLINAILFFNAFLYAETFFYKNLNDSEKDNTLMQVQFPEDCAEILDLSHDSSLEFKDYETIKKKISECKTFLKGRKAKSALKSGSEKIIGTGLKVKEGIQKGLKSGTENITGSVSEETNLFIEDTVKIKDGIVSGTSKLINSTVETGSKLTSGFSSFFKGMFSSEK